MFERVLIAALTAVLCLGIVEKARAETRRPNVVVIITDDQGYGDLGVHGNPKIRTPHLDRLARESVRLRQFYVSPVCSPTRASLLTGRYNYRTGVVDTFLGRSLMHPGEVTLAERLSAAGYQTGIFGKWHLGDNTPLRPLEQGFRQSLVLKGGGIGQPSDLPGGSHYLDPVLLRNGSVRKYRGYCSDVYTDAAIDFLKQASGQPFFLYLPFNCPHDPLEAPDAELASYRGVNLGRDQFPTTGQPLPAKLNEESAARVYAMVTNIDSNVGRLLGALQDAGMAEDTIVVFLTDNGPAFPRYNAGLRGLKGSVYEGGIRVPCFIRWPGKFPPDREVTQAAAHIDLTPTLLDACQVAEKDGPPLDGRSLVPLLRRDAAVTWPDRSICLQWHRGNTPQEGRNFAFRAGRYKLLRPDFARPAEKPPLELYDIEQDPCEQTNLAERMPDLASKLYRDYQGWFRDVSSTRGYAAIPIEIGDDEENPMLLTRQDWRRLADSTDPEQPDGWHLRVVSDGRFDVAVEFQASRSGKLAHLEIQGRSFTSPYDGSAGRVTFHDVPLSSGPVVLESWLDDRKVENRAMYVTATRLHAE